MCEKSFEQCFYEAWLQKPSMQEFIRNELFLDVRFKGGGKGGGGPSQAEIKAQKEQQKQLEEQRAQEEREAERQRRERVSSQRSRRRGLTGRQSLISGSELGEKDKLG